MFADVSSTTAGVAATIVPFDAYVLPTTVPSAPGLVTSVGCTIVVYSVTIVYPLS